MREGDSEFVNVESDCGFESYKGFGVCMVMRWFSSGSE